MVDKRPGKIVPAAESKSNKSILFIVLGVVAVLLAVKVFLDYREKQELQAYYETEMETAKAKLDEINEELQLKIYEIDSLGGDISDLLEAQEQITQERDQLQRTRKANRQLIGKLRRKTDGYEELLREKDKEIKKLLEVNEVLNAENTDLKVDKNKLNKSIVELNEDKVELEEKVEVASRLKAEKIQVVAVSKSGKERTGVLKNRQLDKLKVSFKISENEVAPLEAKEIMIRVIDENDQVIFDVNRGSGSFIIDGKETFYTASQDILFDNSGQDLTFIYEKGSEYDPGTYKMEVFTDGYLMGAVSFSVK
ncbi:MAG: chromosome segregation protein SMC [Bacteroidetes bacterium]|nr:MAG: chromosome segregation protein SMC [Bacteroidota bacterium]